MKKILFVMLGLFSVNSFALDTDDYCKDASKKVWFSRVENVYSINGHLTNGTIQEGEYITTLADGSVIVVPCNYSRGSISSREYSRDGGISTFMVDPVNILTPYTGNKVGDSQVVAVNYEKEVFLVDQDVGPGMRVYFLIKSDAVKAMKEQKLKRSIDNR